MSAEGEGERKRKRHLRPDLKKPKDRGEEEVKEKRKEVAVEPVKVNRDEFLQTLEQVRPGLSTREILQQSSCFVFSGGWVKTFNEEVACKAKSGLPEDFRGAVQAVPLLEILRKLPDEQVTLAPKGNRFVILGKNRKTGVAMEAEVLLPVDSVDKPEVWSKIDGDFTDAVQIVQECASKDQSAFTFTCVHVHPDYMEACDNLQLARYRLKTGVTESCLVRRDSIRNVPSFDFTRMAVTPKWLHFRTADKKMILSCKRYSEKFEDLGYLLEDKGTPTTLPKAVGEAAERCEVFSSQNTEDNLVSVELTGGRVQVTGEGSGGFHLETKKMKYDGKPMKFRIAPKLLLEVLKRHTDCEISRKHRLKIDGGKFKYVCCLEKVK